MWWTEHPHKLPTSVQSSKMTPDKHDIVDVCATVPLALANSLRECCKTLSAVTKKSGASVQWLPASAYRVRFLSLGRIYEPSLLPIAAHLKTFLTDVESFSFSVQGLVGIPSVDHANELWASVQSGQNDFKSLGSKISESLDELGFQSEVLSPHILVAVANESADISEALSPWQDESFGNGYSENFTASKSYIFSDAYSHNTLDSLSLTSA